MKLKSISIALTPDYLKSTYGEYTATAELEGGSYTNSIKVTVDPEQVALIVPILEKCVVDAMARAASDFASDMQARLAGPAVEMGKISSGADSVSA